MAIRTKSFFRQGKFIRLASMMFLIIFIYTILNNLKDALLITSPGSGAEVIPFVKIFAVLPASLLSIIFYSKLLSKISPYLVFYVLASIFCAFFLLFFLILYPNMTYLQINFHKIQILQYQYPKFQWPLAMLAHWLSVWFYVMSELWISLILNLIFWWYVNSNVSISEARKIYPSLIFVSQTAAIVAGFFMRNTNLYFNGDMESMLRVVACVFSCSIMVLTAIYYASNQYDIIEKNNQLAKHRQRKSIKEDFIYLKDNPYLMYLCIIVLSCGICLNLCEVTWKYFVKMQYPSINEYSVFMSSYAILLGLSTMLFVILSNYLFARYPWRLSANITPCIMGSTASIFFIMSGFNLAPLFVIVILGMMQNSMSEASKFSLFDASKELLYIPLSVYEKSKSKAIIDVFGARLGKSLSAVGQGGLLMVTAGDQMSILPYIVLVFFAIIILWLYCNSKLSRFYTIKLQGIKDSPKLKLRA